MGFLKTIGKVVSKVAKPLGGVLGAVAPFASAAAQYFGQKQQSDLQKDFAQNAIQMRVADAKAAGIHPLYALGAQATSYQPQQVGDFGVGDALSSMGQNLLRSEAAGKTGAERTETLGRLAIERAGLENELLRSQISRLNAPHVGPGFPAADTDQLIEGQAQAGVKTSPMPRVVTNPDSAGSADVGSVPDMGWARTKTGFVPVPSLDVKQRIEDVLPHEWAHYFRNNVLPAINPNRITPPFPARPGEQWVWEGGEMRLRPWVPPSRVRRARVFDFN